jgi:hypothetical protein
MSEHSCSRSFKEIISPYLFHSSQRPALHRGFHYYLQNTNKKPRLFSYSLSCHFCIPSLLSKERKKEIKKERKKETKKERQIESKKETKKERQNERKKERKKESKTERKRERKKKLLQNKRSKETK